MKKKYHFITAFFVFFTLTLSGQDLLTEQAPLPCLDKKFTIVAHIVRDSFGEAAITEAAFLQGIESTNEDFKPICVSFEVCEFRYIDNFQYDTIIGNVWSEMKIKYHQHNRINMFFMSKIGDETVLCGFADGSITQMNTGGIVLTGLCISHELGHYFGLPHTFAGSGDELVDGSNCETVGDGICDTPADPFVTGDDTADYVNEDCRFISPKVDANGQFYEPDVGNIMSYYPCTCGFTYGQYLKMANTYLSMPDMW